MRLTFWGRARRGGNLVQLFSKTVLSSSCFGVRTAYIVKAANGFYRLSYFFSFFVVTRWRSFQEIVSYWKSAFSKEQHSELIHTAVHKNIDFVGGKNRPEFFGFGCNTHFFGPNTHFYGRSAFSDAFFKNLARRLMDAHTQGESIAGWRS